MKKSASLTIILALMLSACIIFSACSSESSESHSTSVSECEPVKSAEYEVIRIDNSIYTEDGYMGVNWFFDKLVINSSVPGADAINADMESKAADFFSDSHRAEANEYLNQMAESYPSDTGYNLRNTQEGEVSYNDNGIISLSYALDWFMGGVHNLDFSGITYDLSSGRELRLSDLLSGTEEEMLQQVRDASWSSIVEHYAEELDEYARQTLESKTLSDFDFYVGSSGEIYLIAHVYEYACGAAGSYAFPSGFFASEIG